MCFQMEILILVTLHFIIDADASLHSFFCLCDLIYLDSSLKVIYSFTFRLDSTRLSRVSLESIWTLD